MSTLIALRWPKQFVLRNYGVAVLSVAAALVVARLLQIQYGFEPVLPFVFAVMLGAWFGGVKPGLLAATLSLLAFSNYILVPIYPSDMEKEIPRLLVVALSSVAIALISTAHRGATEALRESELRMRQITENIRGVFWMSTLAFDEVLYVSPAYGSIWGQSLESLRQRPQSFLEAIHPEDRDHAIDIIKGQREKGFDIEYRIVRPDGTIRWIRDRGFPVKTASGDVGRIAGLAEDITDHRQTENALRESAVQLQALSRRLVDLQEFERKELARELHDRVGQNLTALNINLSILRDTVPSTATDELRALLIDSESLIASTIAAIRNVTSELRPPILDDLGLALALDWYAKQVSARSGVSIAVCNLGSAKRPAPKTEIALFRIAQEALNNVVKHALASRVEIILERHGAEYVMSVQDDGAGFDATKEREIGNPGLGLVTMKERSQAIGGRLEVRTFPGSGTLLTVRVSV